jgi:TIR domain
MVEELNADKVFISYAWSSPEHEEWVLELAERLESNGVEVVIDKWDSTKGQNLNAFMQRSVNDPSITKVLVVCDELYTNKANGFEGGVGTETVIISNEVYKDIEQTKFVPIIAERGKDGEAYIPTYLTGTKYIDMSSEQSYEDGYEKLI